MKEARKLPWGEKYFMGNHYTIKVAFSKKVYEMMANSPNFMSIRRNLYNYYYDSPKFKKLRAAASTDWEVGDPDMVLVWGLLTAYEYQVYQYIKKSVQAKLKLEEATALYTDANVYKTLADNRKPLEDEKSKVLDPASVA
jgi:hypothetical protein